MPRTRKPKEDNTILDLTKAPNGDDFQIDSEYEVPPRSRIVESKYPFGSMKPGQSFFVAGDPNATARKLSQATSLYHRQKTGVKLVVRKRFKGQAASINPTQEVGARCWRQE